MKATTKKNDKQSYRRGYYKGSVDGLSQGRMDGFIKGFREALGPHALLVYPAMIPSFEIAAVQPFRALKKQGVYNYYKKTSDEITKRMIAAADTVIFMRQTEPSDYRLLAWAKAYGKKTVYIIDDNFLAIPRDTSIGRYYNQPSIRKTFVKFLKNADIVHVGSAFFGDYLRDKFQSNVVYFPASVDFDLIEQALKPVRSDGEIVIGYEGSNKEEDFVPVVPALLNLLQEYPDSVRLEFFGYVPSALARHPRVRFVPDCEDYRTFLKQLAQANWDIGIAPLKDNFFNSCKTNNKFREYAACRIPGVYSALPTYTAWVNHRETGYLVPHTTSGWYTGLKEMIENKSMRDNIRENAADFAKEQFSVPKCAENWRKLILDL